MHWICYTEFNGSQSMYQRAKFNWIELFINDNVNNVQEFLELLRIYFNVSIVTHEHTDRIVKWHFSILIYVYIM